MFISTGTLRGHKLVLDALELELKTVVNPLTLGPGIRLRSPVRAVCTFNC